MKKGLTLVEILVTIAVFSVLLIGVVQVLMVGDMSWNADAGLLELQQHWIVSHSKERY